MGGSHNATQSVNHNSYFSKQHDPETSWIHDGAVSAWHNPTTSTGGSHSPATSTGHSVNSSKAHDPNISVVYTAGPDYVIDSDGTTTTANGTAQVVAVSDNLTTFESTFTGNRTSDILMFDKDSNKKWSSGDWLVLESGTIDGTYDTTTDTVILEGSGSIANSDSADFQLFVVGKLLNIRFHDSNSNGVWDDGEDIVVDVNYNQAFNP